MKALKYTLAFLISIFALSFLDSCVPIYAPVNGQDGGNYYNPGASSLHPEFNIFHKDDDVSNLNVKLYPAEIKFVQLGDKQPLTSKLRIHYEIYPAYNNPKIQDSATVYLKMSKNKSNAPITSFIQLKVLKGTTCTLAVEVLDIYSKRSAIQVLSINKTDDFNRQNYTASYANHQTIFDSNVSAKDSFIVQYKNPNIQRMFVSFYKRKFPLALPPHIVNTVDTLAYKADTTFNVAYSSSLTTTQIKTGFYLYRCDTTAAEGYGLATFYKNFPFTKRAAEFIEPLQYITTKKEFIKLKEQTTNIKETLDNFWLKFGGTPDKSRELIRIYYNRVLYANLYFSAHTEGWRTDRGMVYLVYGPPYNVSKTDKQEVWNYGENRNSPTMTFTFDKVKNPLTDNYYVLQRKPLYQSSWQDAVMSWRSGFAYSLSTK